MSSTWFCWHISQGENQDGTESDLYQDRSKPLHWVDGGLGSYMRREERIVTDGRSPPGRTAPTPLNTGSFWPSGPKGNEQHPVADSPLKRHGKGDTGYLGAMSPTHCPSALCCSIKVSHLHVAGLSDPICCSSCTGMNEVGRRLE